MAQYVKCLLCKHDDLVRVHRAHMKLDMVETRESLEVQSPCSLVPIVANNNKSGLNQG